MIMMMEPVSGVVVVLWKYTFSPADKIRKLTFHITSCPALSLHQDPPELPPALVFTLEVFQSK